LYSLLLLTPGLGGIGAGGIQESARIAWEGFRRHEVHERRPLALLSFGAVPDVGDDAQGDRIIATESRSRLLMHALLRRWDAETLLIWHVGLAKLLPVLRGRWGQVVVFLHGIEAWRPLSRRVQRLLGPVDRFLCNSEFTWHRVLENNPGFANREHQVVPLGWGKPVAEVSPPEDPPIALMLGRMFRDEDYKGHRELIAAWPRVLERVPDARLWIVGDGDLRPELELAAVPLGEQIRFWGRVSEETKQDLLRRCRCLALPSRGEGFGLVYLEAMRLGRPCLVSTCDAGREVVDPPEAGLEVEPADTGSVVEAISRLIGTGPEWARWSCVARERYQARYTETQFQERLKRALGMVVPLETQSSQLVSR
jgi:phosphatidylinositol alpha-1,6-mannosyltransferase